MKLSVTFVFEERNIRQVYIEDKTAEELYEEISNCKGWYRYEKNKCTHAVNMNLVTYFNIK
ncbi:hypothetical protein [Priestia endophytica]|uniref:Uncharacterized protein n=1 Tax=Priestia endophytica TaxID=135735 RepID=A0AAX1Q5V8_9BACI|nr:hypothetical protein [Priestia endophytica]MBG9813918.1 hypothetical protein [Priestia endophytica]MCM3537679.1 hypothetical protein [Priestia endophytica]RAS73542.1 hypothetical protein A3864_20670 [Priestia endophytica]RAS86068.1 hypothetical protein A4R27_02565 [Priestia endophytica]RAS90710.1 hypothetical protein A3863_09660 [Priestia endophytica]